VELIETSTFTRQIICSMMRRMGNFNPDLRRIHSSALSSGAVVGYARCALPLDREASEAARASYYWAVRRNVILLLYAYAKNVTADLTPKQVSQLARAVIEEFGDEEADV